MEKQYVKVWEIFKISLQRCIALAREGPSYWESDKKVCKRRSSSAGCSILCFRFYAIFCAVGGRWSCELRVCKCVLKMQRVPVDFSVGVRAHRGVENASACFNLLFFSLFYSIFFNIHIWKCSTWFVSFLAPVKCHTLVITLKKNCLRERIFLNEGSILLHIERGCVFQVSSCLQLCFMFILTCPLFISLILPSSSAGLSFLIVLLNGGHNSNSFLFLNIFFFTFTSLLAVLPLMEIKGAFQVCFFFHIIVRTSFLQIINFILLLYVLVSLFSLRFLIVSWFLFLSVECECAFILCVFFFVFCPCWFDHHRACPAV